MQLEKQRDCLCEWVLDVSRRLLDPADDESDATDPSETKPIGSTAGSAAGSAAGSQLSLYNQEHTSAEERFRHFVSRISKLQVRVLETGGALLGFVRSQARSRQQMGLLESQTP